MTSPRSWDASELTQRFEAARHRCVEAARERLATTFPFDIELLSAEEPELAAGPLAGRPLIGGDPLAAVERAVQLAWGPGRRPSRLVHPEAIGVLDPGTEHQHAAVDPREPQLLMARLDDGWMLEIPGMVEGEPTLARLVADIETVVDTVTDPVGFFGIRSALGPPPVPTPFRRLIVQIAGQRQLLVSREDGEPDKFRLAPPMVVLVPAGRPVHHLPLDGDTLHLEIPIPLATDEGPARMIRRARQPARTARRLAIARGVLNADPATGHRFRWATPGGVHVLAQSSSPDRPVELVAGGRRLMVTPEAVEALVRLADGDWTVSSELGDDEQANGFVEGLWQAGLLEASEPEPPPFAERVNRVGHADVLTPEQCAAVFDSLAGDWRAPEPWEVHIAAGAVGFVEVCEVPPDLDVLQIAAQALAIMNREIFRFATTGGVPQDRVLVVRHRAADTGAGLQPTDYEPDTGEDMPGRKLTFAIPLDGAEGQPGRIRLAGGSDSVGSTPGQISVFASFRPWVLEPPDTGVRHTLLGRIHGPPFS